MSSWHSPPVTGDTSSALSLAQVLRGAEAAWQPEITSARRNPRSDPEGRWAGEEDATGGEHSKATGGGQPRGSFWSSPLAPFRVAGAQEWTLRHRPICLERKVNKSCPWVHLSQSGALKPSQELCSFLLAGLGTTGGPSPHEIEQIPDVANLLRQRMVQLWQ